MKKLIIFIRLYWLRVLVISVFSAVFITAAFFLSAGLENYFSLERPSRQQISAYMGFFLIIGIFTAFIQLPLFFGMHYYFLQGGGLGRLGREKIGRAKVNVKWDEVIGMEGAKREAWELIKLLKDRSMIKAIGGKIIKGTLMIGPPGCGKTYLAKAIATECGLPLLAAVGSEFVGMFVGQGASQMKSLFKQARALASMEGGCIVFIDEIDSFARHRMADTGWGGSISHNATINQFLTELDGLRQAENNIVVIAATNVSEDELDSAIMRAGRFDRKIHIALPNLKEREELFAFYLGRIKAEADIDGQLLARKALRFSPADIDNMVREAGLIALRSKRETINRKDLLDAYERVRFGLRSNVILSEKQKLQTAYHEAGHAVIAYLTHPTDDVIKASIIPYKDVYGHVWHLNPEEGAHDSRESLLANIKISLGSYAAEQKKFGTNFTGVGGAWGTDLSNALYTARLMAWQLGMGKSGLIGDFKSAALGWSRNGDAFLSEKIKEAIEADVQDIIQACLKDVKEILEQKWDVLEYFAQELLKKEELEYDEIENIFGKFGLQPASRMAASG